MKVRLKVPKEINGAIAQPGWVFGVDQPTGEAWIAAGEAERVADEVRSLKYAQAAPLMLQCVDPAPAPAPDPLPEKKHLIFSREKS